MSRYNLKDTDWDRIKGFLPLQKTGRPAKDHRMILNAIIWILRTGAPWRDMPPEFGSWKSVYTRFSRWKTSGLLERIFSEISMDKDEESIIVDATIIRAHQHAAGAKGGNSIRP